MLNGGLLSVAASSSPPRAGLPGEAGVLHRQFLLPKENPSLHLLLPGETKRWQAARFTAQASKILLKWLETAPAVSWSPPALSASPLPLQTWQQESGTVRGEEHSSSGQVTKPQ